MSLFGSPLELFGTRKPGTARTVRRLPGVETLEERSLLSISIGPVLRLPQVPTSATFAARLSPSDAQAIQVSADGGTTFTDVGPLPGGSGTPHGAFVVTGLAGGKTSVLVLVTDFNHDGLPDLAVNFGPSVQVFLGQPDGSFEFTFGLTRDALAQPGMLAVGDFDRNGTADLLAVSRLGTGNRSLVSLIAGNGDGAFQTRENVVEGPARALGTLEGLSAAGDLTGSVLLHTGGIATLLSGELTATSLELGFAHLAHSASAEGDAPSRGLPGDPAHGQDGAPARDADTATGEPAAVPPADSLSEAPATLAMPLSGTAGAARFGPARRGDGLAENGSLSLAVLDGMRVDAVEAPLPEPPADTATSPAATGDGLAARGNPLQSGPQLVGLRLAGDGAGPLPALPSPLLMEPDEELPDCGARPGVAVVPGPSAVPTIPVALPALHAGVPAATDPADSPLSIRELSRILAQALYLGSLKRPGSEASADAASELAQATGDTRLLVADLVQRSSEAFGRLVQCFFVLFLGRAAEAGEDTGWVAMLLGGDSEEKVLSAFLSTAEFYNRAGTLVPAGAGDERFIQALYRLLLHRPATDAEAGGWLSALPALGRAGVAYQLLASAEYRALQVQSFYDELLHHPAPTAEVAVWAQSPFDLLTIRLFFEARPEVLRGR
jgi:hypothetical protein